MIAGIGGSAALSAVDPPISAIMDVSVGVPRNTAAHIDELRAARVITLKARTAAAVWVARAAALPVLLLGLVTACGTTAAPLSVTLPSAPADSVAPAGAAAQATTPGAAGTQAASAGPAPIAAPPTGLCRSGTAYQGAGPYDGGWGCRVGEAATVSRLVDAATFELVDGRHVRLGGIVVREASSCAGQQAMAATRSQVQEGQQVNMIIEPGVGSDPYGSTWAYLQSGSGFTADLGRSLATAGLAEPFQQGANPVYVQAISPLVDLARQSHTGQFGPPCGPAVPETPMTDETPAPAGNPRLHVNVGHHNSRDGALTGGFCRHHWWC